MIKERRETIIRMKDVAPIEIIRGQELGGENLPKQRNRLNRPEIISFNEILGNHMILSIQYKEETNKSYDRNIWNHEEESPEWNKSIY